MSYVCELQDSYTRTMSYMQGVLSWKSFFFFFLFSFFSFRYKTSTSNCRRFPPKPSLDTLQPPLVALQVPSNCVPKY